MDPSEIKLARSLASPDAELRLTTAKQLYKFLAIRPADGSDVDMDLLKLWKALYYCLWLCDKAPMQAELAEMLARGMAQCFSPQAFLTAFCRTVTHSSITNIVSDI
jgi:hypothetical protein